MEKFNLLRFFDPVEEENVNVSNVEPRTEYERDYEVSPIFPFTNSDSISAGASTVIDFESQKPSSAKYLPFNTLQIINNSSAEIIVYVNQRRDRGMKIPSGTIQPIDSSIAPAISSLAVKNNSSATTIDANELQFITSKDNVTTNLVLKRIHKLLLGGGK